MDTRTNIILVPVDFSQQSLIALDQTYNLAHLSGSEITLLNVITTNAPIWNLFTDREKKDIELRLTAKLQNLADEIKLKAGLKVNFLLEKGKLTDTILDVSHRLNIRFIVMGTVSSRNIMQKIIGSSATRIIREATCPVITIKGRHHRNGCENILLPLDLTEVTTQKVSMAIWLGKYFKSTIHAVTATSAKDFFVLNRMETQLKQVKEDIEKNGVHCTTHMISLPHGGNEKKASVLLAYANDVLADLIMIMTQQEFDVKDYFIGTLAKEIIHHSEIPVMSCIPRR